MSQNQYETARGYEGIYATQFSIFLANRVGQLKEVLDTFTEQKLRVLGISIVDATDWAVIRLVFDDPDKARIVLDRHRIPYTDSEVLLVVLEDEDSLALLCGHLLRAEINVHVAYSLTVRPTHRPVMAFHVEDPILAAQILTRHGFVVLGKEDLQNPSL